VRLLFVTSSLAHGGAERHTITLANRLSERGHECHFVFVKNRTAQLGRIHVGPRGSLHCLEARRYFDPRAIVRFARTIGAVKPAIIVTANEYALLYATLARRLSAGHARVVVTYHATETVGAKEFIKMLAYRPLFWAAGCVIFVCEYQRRRWLSRGVAARRNEVIYNGVDIEHFVERALPGGRASARRELGFAESDYIVGVTAALRPEKNHHQLIDAIARLRVQGLAARALLIGDGPMRGAIEAHARRLGVAEHVTITGFESDVRPYVLACDTMALCSVTEALSLAAIEAMALGKPVVHSDVGGAREVITPGSDGFLFRVNDTDSFVRWLALLADRQLRERMGARARATIERSFAEGSMVERYDRLLRELGAHSSIVPAGPPVGQRRGG
jgi:glycosyltransferase involved in cell wall biosynthesis